MKENSISSVLGFPIRKMSLLLSSVLVSIMTGIALFAVNGDFAEVPFKALQYEYLTYDVPIIGGILAFLAACIICARLFAPISQMRSDEYDAIKRTGAYLMSMMLVLYVVFVILTNMHIGYTYSMAP